MSLSRIFLNADLEIGQCVELPTATTHYVKNVLRLKNDQKIVLFNNQLSTEYVANIELHNKHVFARILSSEITQVDSPLKTTLIQAVGKPDHVDLLIQKATELGISQVFLFNSERTQTHLKSARLKKKLAHWKGIMISACEQCGRNTLPKLSFKPDLQTCLKAVEKSNKIVLDFNGVSIRSIKQIVNPELPFSMLIGPEGGLSPTEIQQANNANFTACTMGPRILRMETAAISILNIIQHYFGDMP